MSFSQFLAKPSQEYDDFAVSWQAGIAGSQSFTKLKNYDIEAVNVVKTCEKLNSTLQNTRYFFNEFQGHEDSEKQCAVKISNIPFRAVSNIWFGTLKIYQQQVNNLFRMSKDLFVRSNQNNFNQLEAIKRKSSLKSNKLIKKRRLTISNTNEKTIISSNYSQLIDELEKLTQEPILNSIDEFSNAISNTCSVTQLQIREITIREISETTFTTKDVVQEDSGFDDATHEEIEYFLNSTDDNLQQITDNIRKILPEKRISIAEQGNPIKRSRYSIDYLSEKPNFNENLTQDTGSISDFKGFKTPTEGLKTLVKEHHYENNNYTAVIETVKQEPIEDYYYAKQNFDRPINKREKKKSKLIIDFCTKIDINEILHEMKKSNSITKSSRKKLYKFYKAKKFVTALGLLNTFNRRSLKLSQTLKQEVYYTNEQFQKDYLSILRDIFKQNFNEKLASEIYSPKIRKQNKPKNLEKRLTKEVLYQQQQETDLYNSSDYLHTVSDPYNNNLRNKLTNVLKYKNNGGNNESATFCNQYEWRPYAVMMKLLSLWSCLQTSKIDAAILFKLAENRFDKALGFHSLLSLSKNRFVVLTTFPETIIIQKIVMGEAAKIVANNSP